MVKTSLLLSFLDIKELLHLLFLLTFSHESLNLDISSLSRENFNVDIEK